MFFRRKKSAGPIAEINSHRFTSWLLHQISGGFAITDQVELRPEYIQDLTVESIIVGFMADNHVIYAMEDVTWDEATQTIAFHSRENGKSISQVERFSLLFPLDNSDDRNMAYHQKEEFSRVGLFKRGNTLTIMTKNSGHTRYSIDGVVTTYLRLKSGLFANHEVAVLSLDPMSFKQSERRKHQRIDTDVDVSLKAIKGSAIFGGRIVDYVEGAARVVLDDPAALNVLVQDKPVSMTMELEEVDRQYEIEGTISKAQENEVVVNFRKIYKGKSFAPFGKLDGIEIKAMLQKVMTARQK